jgi:hypothetical protein
VQVPPSTAEHAIDLPHAPAAALRALGTAAEEWGADFAPAVAGGSDGELRLPVVAGLRRGLLSGPVAVTPAGRGSRLVFRPVAQDYYLETSAIALLSVAAAGALLTVAWPLFPQLLPVAPLGAVLAVGGWFLVLPRLRGHGPEEFLASVAGHAGAETGAPAKVAGQSPS